MMTVFILGNPQDTSCQVVEQAIHAQGAAVSYLDTSQFPYNMAITLALDPSRDAVLSGSIKHCLDKQLETLNLADITGVYNRICKLPALPRSEADSKLQELAFWNVEAMLGTLMRAIPHEKWINSVPATQAHYYKGIQLQQMAELGVPIPRTWWTNQLESLREIYAMLNGNAIFKPVRGWATTEALTPEHLTQEAAEKLVYCPVTVQEKIEGYDVRCYVVGEQVYPVLIQAETLDFRESPDAPRRAIALPERCIQECLSIARVLDYRYVAIDARQQTDGTLIYFEANPTGVFIGDSLQAGYPILDDLVKLLLNN